MNYIYILRMFTSIDDTLYPQVKERLLKVKKICKYLELLDRENDISKVFTRLETDTQIHDLDEPEEADDDNKDKEKGANKEYEDFIFDDSDDENQANNELKNKDNEGEEY